LFNNKSKKNGAREGKSSKRKFSFSFSDFEISSFLFFIFVNSFHFLWGLGTFFEGIISFLPLFFI